MKVKKDWWKTFFNNTIGQVMFSMPQERTRQEVQTILKETKLSKGSKILDLGCGVGRHSIEFAKQGMSVVGLDFSKDYVAEAKKKVKKERLNQQVSIIYGDMRKINQLFSAGEFDLVVSLFNSFGYFDKRSDDKKVLRGAAHVLKQGGLLVVNTLNRSGAERQLIDLPKLQGKSDVSLGREPIKNVFMIDKASYNPKKQRTLIEWTIVDTRARKAKIQRQVFSQNVYSQNEFKAMLAPLGLNVMRLWGPLGGGNFSPKSWHQTFIARKSV